MELVASRAGDNVNFAAGPAPVLRAVETAQHFEFSYGIHAGKVEQAEVAAAVYVISAVNGPVILREAASVNGEVNLIGSAAWGFHTHEDRVRHGRRDSRHQGNHLFIVAGAERELANLGAINQAARCG